MATTETLSMLDLSSSATRCSDVASLRARTIAWSMSCMGSIASSTFWDPFLTSPTPMMTGVIRPGTIFKRDRAQTTDGAHSRGNPVVVGGCDSGRVGKRE